MSNYFIPGTDDMLYSEHAYNSRSLSDIFPTAELFEQRYEESGLAPDISRISSETVPVLYYLLMARFANSYPKSSDENRFIQSLYATIMMYGPTWEAKLRIQKEFRDLIGTEELLGGSTQINNHSFNPSTPPAVDAFSPLSTINDQTATKRLKPKIEAYSGLVSTLKSDITDAFLDKFDPLFRNMLSPDGANLYITTPEEQEILDL